MLAPSEYEGTPTRGYLDSATYGLPPRSTLRAMEEALEGWRTGRRWRDWEEDGEECRSLFAGLVGARAEDIALVTTTSSGGRPGRGEPGGGGRLERRPLRARLHLGDAALARVSNGAAWSSASSRSKRSRTRSTSAPRSSRSASSSRPRAGRRPGRAPGDRRPDLPRRDAGGRRLPGRRRRDRLRRGARLQVAPLSAGARVPLRRARAAPREIEPWTAGWKSREDPYADYYGLPELTRDARRLDVSLPWLPAAGGRASLELFASLGIERIAAHNLGLARALTGELGLPDAASPIVRLAVDDAEGAAQRLQESGIACSFAAAPSGSPSTSTTTRPTSSWPRPRFARPHR